MKVYEYQARDVLASAGVPVPAGEVVREASAAADAYAKAAGAEGGLAVVKAQVHAGGRGKAGFVKLVRSAAEATEAAGFMLSNKMVSVQTGPEGLDVSTLLVAAGVDIAKRGEVNVALPEPERPAEFYLAITTDRDTRRNVLIASSEGGVEIEEVAAKTPDKIIKQPLHPLAGMQPHQARRIAFELGLRGKLVGQAVRIITALAGLFESKDCSLAEINPLVVLPPSEGAPDGTLMAIDAKFDFDDNAVFRHKDLTAMVDHSEKDPAEAKAEELGLSYIKLDGNIGCLVNGAGLAMATMDTIKHHGGEPANFLDVGGGASQDAVTEAFRIILSDDKVSAILVNIFGGIMDCNRIAGGIVGAAKEVGFEVPLVVRLEGNNADAGRKTLEAAAGDLTTLTAASDLGDAAQKVVAAIG